MSDSQTEISPDHEHFASIPWVAPHLSGQHDSRIITSTPESRVPKANGEDSLFAETLRTQSTIIAMLQVYEEPAFPVERIDSMKTFVTLGGGLNGHPSVLHGGIVCTILDEVLGALIILNQKGGRLPDAPIMTAYLNTTFLKPVPNCATHLAQAKIVKAEGRKIFVEAWIEDSDGTVLSRADALFIALRSSL
ncbi:hypothetical protein M426DRAFT_325460 [Hypoxylon sp. CI-4A]|nr:hypothetical protein M426DRAFT_325460 [Hypoxylon sp. CI-4A]